MSVSTFTHGASGPSSRGYAAGCRCQRCKAAWAAYIKQRRYQSGNQRPLAEALAVREIETVEASLARDAEDDVEVSMTLTPLGARLLVELQRRLGLRRADVVEVLLRDRGAELLREVAA